MRLGLLLISIGISHLSLGMVSLNHPGSYTLVDVNTFILNPLLLDPNVSVQGNVPVQVEVMYQGHSYNYTVPFQFTGPPGEYRLHVLGGGNGTNVTVEVNYSGLRLVGYPREFTSGGGGLLLAGVLAEVMERSSVRREKPKSSP